MAKSQLKSESLVLFSAIIRIAFENELSSTLKLISSLERITCPFFLKRVLFGMFYFHFELQKVDLSQDRARKKSCTFLKLTAKLNGDFQPK